MANLTLSGYLTTATSITWASGTTLASLANNGYTDLADEIDNSTNKYAFADLYADLGTANFSGVPTSALEVFLVPSVDGTNYPTWTTGTSDAPSNSPHMVAVMPTAQTNAVQDMTFLRIPLPQGKYKWAFRNRGGVALNATNTVYWRPGSYAG